MLNIWLILVYGFPSMGVPLFMDGLFQGKSQSKIRMITRGSPIFFGCSKALLVDGGIILAIMGLE